MPTATDVANYFLSIDETENDVTDLKLQKLCAYAQALSLALLCRPLFEEDLEAWQHGPVVPSLYDMYAKYGNLPIPCSGMSEKYAREPFDDEQKFVLELVKENYFSKAAWKLRDMSHDDFHAEWGSKQVIPKSEIEAAFARSPVVIRMKQASPYVDTAPLADTDEVLHVLGL